MKITSTYSKQVIQQSFEYSLNFKSLSSKNKKDREILLTNKTFLGHLNGLKHTTE